MDNLCEHLHWISSRVRELDQKHSTHINPWHDAWWEAATVDKDNLLPLHTASAKAGRSITDLPSRRATTSTGARRFRSG
jgi:hypothetical protein